MDMKVGMDVSATTASSNVTLIDLFHKKRVKGWWPVFSYEEGERDLTVCLKYFNIVGMSQSLKLTYPRGSWSWRLRS